MTALVYLVVLAALAGGVAYLAALAIALGIVVDVTQFGDLL